MTSVGRTLYDAGCGPGALAIEAAARGAKVVAVDVSPTLIELASQRVPPELAERIEFGVGDMLTAVKGPFDYVVAMDSLIHYAAADKLDAIGALAGLARHGLLIHLRAAHPGSGRHARRRAACFRAASTARRPSSRLPNSSCATALPPRRPCHGWQTGRTGRVSVGFYISQGLELDAR